MRVSIRNHFIPFLKKIYILENNLARSIAIVLKEARLDPYL